MKQIICLSATPWKANPTRTQRFLSVFPDTRILFFQPGTPNGTPVEGQKVGPLTHLYTLPHTPAMTEQHPRLSPASHRRLIQVILDAMEYHEFRQPLLWVCSPFYDELLEEIPRSGLIYDCDQDWSALPIALESQLTCRADIVFAASPGLQEHLSPCNSNILVVPNGIPFALHDAVRTDGYLCPPELLRLPRPLFGYVGTVWSNLNLVPLLAAANAHPEWSFVLIGKVSRKNPWLAELYDLDNVHFLGSRRPEDIPPYLRHLNVGISLLRDGMEDNDVLSPRIYEYFAQGLPVVAMYHHLQKEVYPALMDSAYSVTRFVEACEKVAAHDPVEKKVQRYLVAQGSDWDARCQQVRQAVKESRLLDEINLMHSPLADHNPFQI